VTPAPVTPAPVTSAPAPTPAPAPAPPPPVAALRRHVTRLRAALRLVKRLGTTTTLARVGDSWDMENGYQEYVTVSPPARVAAAVLAAVPAPPPPEHVLGVQVLPSAQIGLPDHTALLFSCADGAIQPILLHQEFVDQLVRQLLPLATAPASAPEPVP